MYGQEQENSPAVQPDRNKKQVNMWNWKPLFETFTNGNTKQLANFKHNIENHLQKIAETANLKHQHSSRPSCSTSAYVKTSWWIIYILPELWQGVIVNTYFILTMNIIISLAYKTIHLVEVDLSRRFV